MVGTTLLTECKDCGRSVDNDKKSCPYCGGALIRTSRSAYADYTSDTSSRKKKIIIVIAIAVAAIILVWLLAGGGGVLIGDDLTAYNLIYNNAHRFKDPSSVRLVGGCLGVDKDCGFFAISAINGFGARNTSYYYMTSTWLMEDENALSDYDLYTDRKSLNIDLINQKLAETLSY
ncbi:MAG: hypothetical protein NC084_12275 [Bacteroides sp.]|nr:hypothetical protein [Eubacterium sp.]MCM1419545.1 hypothetical protein [Roseburia sp.]MCM1463469.1 hypothetical protein [Bacteroides sp.]